MELKKIPMRDGFGNGLLKLCAEDPRVVALDADVSGSTRSGWVRKEFPEHFLNIGIAEQDLIGTASGLALGGMIPFVSTYCVFLCGRAWDQIRTTVAYNNLNVKFGGAHAGISVGPDGATHQALEDIALMRVLPNMTVICPCDSVETEKATLAIAKRPGPCFIRFGREAVPIITDENTPFEVGKANVMREGTDVAIFAIGHMVYFSLLAADALAAEGISAQVVNMHAIKPLDGACIERAAATCGALVTVEEHQMYGGMTGAVSEYLAAHCPAPLETVSIRDTFGESGEPEELLTKYGLMPPDIIAAAKRAIARKKGK